VDNSSPQEVYCTNFGYQAYLLCVLRANSHQSSPTRQQLTTGSIVELEKSHTCLFSLPLQLNRDFQKSLLKLVQFLHRPTGYQDKILKELSRQVFYL